MAIPLSYADSSAKTVASELVEAITIPSGFVAITFSRIETCSAISASEGGP